MSTISKEKNLFVITLDNGKSTSFNFADGSYYGVSGKKVQKFSNDAYKVLKEYSDNSFLAYYFNEIKKSWAFYDMKNWSYHLVETIYSLYNNEYSKHDLLIIAEYCHRYDYTLNKKNVKILNEVLKMIKENSNYFDTWSIKSAMDDIELADYPQFLRDVLDHVDLKTKDIIKKDAKKIIFRNEHENWRAVCSSITLATLLTKYYQMCEVLKKEIEYKNFLLTYALTCAEFDLISEKLCADYQLNANLKYENDDFSIIIPTTTKEFQNEADYQQNCVFRIYFPRVKAMETHVVFIRRKNDIETPYITCEVSNNGKIIQYLTRYNYRVNDEKAILFQHEYQKFLDENF